VNLLITLKMSNCIFCKIISGAEPTELLYEDNEIVIFKDIKPAAKFHYLAVPKEHIKDVKSLTVDYKSLVETLIDVGKRTLQEKGADINDIRLGFHVPPFNSVQHLHLHLITPTSDMSFLGRMIFKPNSWWFVTSDYILDNLPANKL